jgi:glucans biosynthesis protein
MNRIRRNPMDEILNPPHVSMRCGAHARTTGAPCKRWASIGSARCRMHGGAVGSGRPKSHGRRSAGARRGRELVRLAKYLLRRYHKKPAPLNVAVKGKD